MNRFRTKRKPKEVTETPGVDGENTTRAPLPKHTKSKWGRKVVESEEKKDLDLEHALPSSSEFRTSLLMNGLSARFSMLREQDDPSSMLGKASDDSVLYPNKRASRLDGLGLHGLSDIAEVSSITGSIRPPFAFGRADSYSTGDEYGTDDDTTHSGSIMNRAKPGEGNILFGGRQKIYKISSNKSAGEGARNMGGRALYEGDVSLSAFQKLRERRRSCDDEAVDPLDGDPEASQPRGDSPPPAGYNRKRETSSTTSSNGVSISRSSTVATSVTSQRTPSLNGSRTPSAQGNPTVNGVERIPTKVRRLYEPGLDQHMHAQQHSAVSRIDTLTRHRALGAHSPTGMHSPVSATSISTDRWDGSSITAKTSMPNIRAISPPQVSGQPLDFQFGATHVASSDSGSGLASPPISPISEDQNPIITLPNDRGKATAMGAFSRPSQPYDDGQYSQRQLQVQRGRDNIPRRPRDIYQAAANQSAQSLGKSDFEATPSVARSRSSSAAQTKPDSVHQGPTMPITPELDTGHAFEAPQQTFLNMDPPSPASSELGQEALLDVPSGDLDLGPSIGPEISRLAPLEKPPESDHPALRSQSSRTTLAEGQASRAPSTTQPDHSPTLGLGTELSSIRQHLRSDSNTSSIYGGTVLPSAGLVSRFPQDTPVSPEDYAPKGNPWESEDLEVEPNNVLQADSTSEHQPLESAAPVADPHSVPENHAENTIKAQGDDEMSFEPHHSRGDSTETQRDRRDFHLELAARRRRVQENLKSYVETESRSASPMPGSESTRDVGAHRTGPLAILKGKSSRTSLVVKPQAVAPQSRDGPTKAMKMLGLGSATIASGSPPPNRKTFEVAGPQKLQTDVKPSPPPLNNDSQSKFFRQARRAAQKDREQQLSKRREAQRPGPAGDRDFSGPRVGEIRRKIEDDEALSLQSAMHAPSMPERARPDQPNVLRKRDSSFESKHSMSSGHSTSRPASRATRDRSSSDASGPRSKSRNRRYRDESLAATAEHHAVGNQEVGGDMQSSYGRTRSPAMLQNGFASPSRSPAVGSQQASRTNSRDRGENYFDTRRAATPNMHNLHDIGSARSSPSVPFSINTTPPIAPPSPPSSDMVPTNPPGFQAQGRIPDGLRRNVNKTEISEPTLLSSTSRVDTVDLPEGASLKNGMEIPPVPAVNPRRRQTRIMFGLGKKDEGSALPTITTTTDVLSAFSDEEPGKPRQKLRKSTSEGGSLNARARAAANQTPSPAVPSFPSSPRPAANVDGMF